MIFFKNVILFEIILYFENDIFLKKYTNDFFKFCYKFDENFYYEKKAFIFKNRVIIAFRKLSKKNVKKNIKLKIKKNIFFFHIKKCSLKNIFRNKKYILYPKQPYLKKKFCYSKSFLGLFLKSIKNFISFNKKDTFIIKNLALFHKNIIKPIKIRNFVINNFSLSDKGKEISNNNKYLKNIINCYENKYLIKLNTKYFDEKKIGYFLKKKYNIIYNKTYYNKLSVNKKIISYKYLWNNIIKKIKIFLYNYNFFRFKKI
ncbi:hypothetical protein [Candidatus Vidania fulgoroideorum]